MTRSIAEREAALMGAVESMDVTRREAVLANEAKSQFLTNMSHELRTPLNAIVGFSEMLEQQVLGPVGVPRYVDYARDIRDSGKYLLGLIERMLDLAGAESGNLAIAREAIAPCILLRESVILLRSFADKIGVEISLPDNAMTWPLILGDAPRLRQAFVNIVHNAVKFSPESSEVTITAAIDGRQLHLRITDRGAGIDPKLLSSVVRPFHRLRSALDGREQGMGVGLPFAKAIVELHGGTLVLESTPDVGTTVCIVLPLMAGTLHDAA
jgi:signal transduction histidine kinase